MVMAKKLQQKLVNFLRIPIKNIIDSLIFLFSFVIIQM